jgi:orotate phosphoribosyltransferase-like protein
MAKRGPKQKPIEPERVKQLARQGYQQQEIAEQLGVSHDTYFKRMNQISDISVAYKNGRAEFLEWVKMTRAQQVLSAFDRLVQEGNPAAVIFGMKAIVGLQETVTHNHTANGNPIANDERLKELEAKRRMLMQSTEIVIDAKKDDE